MNLSNARFINAIGWYDVTVSLPDGIPFDYTVAPGDDAEMAVAIRAQMAASPIDIAAYVPPAPAAIISVSRRQFMMQLEIDELTATVASWVASQDPLVQIAFAESGSFVRSAPMLVAGFDALSFTTGQIDAFFAAAAEL